MSQISVLVLWVTVFYLLISKIFNKVGDSSSDPNDKGLTFEEASLIARSDTFLLNMPYLLPLSTISVFVGNKRFFAAESALGLYLSWIYGASGIILEFAFVIMTSIA